MAGATVPPRSALVERRTEGPFLREPRLHQVLGTSIGAFPLPPQDAAQLAADPTVERLQRRLGFSQSEVRCPTPQHRVQLGNRATHASPSRTFEHITDLVLQPLPAARRDP